MVLQSEGELGPQGLGKEERRELDLYYLDETGFTLTPAVPYAWQKKGVRLECLSTSNGKRQSVLGLLSKRGGFQCYITEGTVTSQLVIACIDAFVKQRKRSGIQRPLVIVLDNASMHTSAMLRERAVEWKRQSVRLQYLPPYSPELNLIEILWRRIKYAWLPLDAYSSWQKLTDSIEFVLKNIGSKYQISFA